MVTGSLCKAKVSLFLVLGEVMGVAYGNLVAKFGTLSGWICCTWCTWVCCTFGTEDLVYLVARFGVLAGSTLFSWVFCTLL